MKKNLTALAPALCLVLLACNGTTGEIIRTGGVAGTKGSIVGRDGAGTRVIPAAPNLDPVAGRITLVDKAACLGDSVHVESDGSNDPGRRHDCMEGKAEAKPVDHRARYRLEVLSNGSTRKLVISATVIHKEIALEGAKLPRSLEKQKKKDAAAFARACGQSYVSKLEIGGRLELYGEIRVTGETPSLPAGVPTRLEVGDTAADLAYFKTVLEAHQAAFKGDFVGMGSSLHDSRPAKDVAGIPLDSKMSAEFLADYVDGYRKAPAFAGDVAIFADAHSFE